MNRIGVRILFKFLLIFFFPSFLTAEESEVIPLLRYFIISPCTAQRKCIAPEAKQLETAQVKLKLEPFSKGGKGVHGWDKNSLTLNHITFRSEIHLIRWQTPKKSKFYLYAMLRSGKRNGKLKMIDFDELSEIQNVLLTDDPIKTKKGFLKAQLLISSTVNLPSPMKFH
jgi:hypothetical protein